MNEYHLNFKLINKEISQSSNNSYKKTQTVRRGIAVNCNR